MKKYLGVKIIRAEEMSERQFKESKGFPSTSLKDRDGYKVVYEDGYESWSPKDVFEKAYRKIDNLTFGLAIEASKQGKKVTRKGWNGKGMFLMLIHPYLNDQFEVHEKDSLVGTLLPYIAMKTADNGLVPWLASQTDMLAEDWMIVE